MAIQAEPGSMLIVLQQDYKFIKARNSNVTKYACIYIGFSLALVSHNVVVLWWPSIIVLMKQFYDGKGETCISSVQEVSMLMELPETK